MPSFSVAKVTPSSCNAWCLAFLGGVSDDPLSHKGFAARYAVRMAHYEEWFKLLWNRCVEAVDETPECTDPDHPLFGMLETMHGIAEDQPHMWLQPPTEPGGRKPDPILNQFDGY